LDLPKRFLKRFLIFQGDFYFGKLQEILERDFLVARAFRNSALAPVRSSNAAGTRFAPATIPASIFSS